MSQKILSVLHNFSSLTFDVLIIAVPGDVYSVERMDVALKMEKHAEQAALANEACLPNVPFPVRYPPYPHCRLRF